MEAGIAAATLTKASKRILQTLVTSGGTMAKANDEPPNGMGQTIKLLWQIYCLPGRLLAEYWYLWSKKGQIWQSNRRRKHPFVHFFYSTVIYVVAFLIISIFSGDRSAHARYEAPPTTAIEGTDNGESPENLTAIRPDQADPKARFQAHAADPVEEVAEGSSDTPIPDHAIESAMAEAFKSGASVRVEGSGTTGYAVPSEPDHSSGCRTVAFTIDGDTQSSQSKTLCP